MSAARQARALERAARGKGQPRLGDMTRSAGSKQFKGPRVPTSLDPAAGSDSPIGSLSPAGGSSAGRPSSRWLDARGEGGRGRGQAKAEAEAVSWLLPPPPSLSSTASLPSTCSLRRTSSALAPARPARPAATTTSTAPVPPLDPDLALRNLARAIASHHHAGFPRRIE